MKKDISQLGKHVVDLATGEAEKPREKNRAAVALGKLGGSKGGKARASALTADERSDIAKKASRARKKKT